MTEDATNDLDARITAWLERDPDREGRAELTALQQANDHDELARRFAGRLQFGTAGLRGVVGAGPARMNRLVIRETSTGLASYLEDNVADARNRGIVIAYDARPDSAQFAQDAASVFLGAGFKVFLTEEAQPTPVGAYGVLRLGAAAGIVVTASHNPPEYNGYKVYWENGAQIIPPHDAGIAECINDAANAELPWKEIGSGLESGQLEILGDSFVDEYSSRVREVCTAPRSVKKIGVAYSAMHGVGARLAVSLLTESGLCEVASVPSQHDPDGTFPTVAFPNPEEPGAMDAVIALAGDRGAALACANDPDADRLAVAARIIGGKYVKLTGDQIGILLGDYCLQQERDFVPIVCASLVSSRMLGRIAADHGALFFETLTGFKWLSNVALQHEDAQHRFLFAYEEALGYAFGQAVRDKDGLSALLAFTQMAAGLAARGRTVIDQLERLYRQHGLFVTEQRSLATAADSPSVTDLLRERPPTEIAGVDVSSRVDLTDSKRRYADGRVETLDFHPSDVLIYYLDDDSRIIVRPSGTEPKVKCYYEVVETIEGDTVFAAADASARSRLEALIESHQRDIAALFG